MSRTPSRRRAVGVLAAVTTAAAPFLIPTTAADAAPSAQGPKARYIVQVAGAPIASYTGGESGIPATKPAPGQKVNRHSSAAKTLSKRLQTRHGQVVQSVGASPSAITHDYDVAFNGFTAELTPAQAAALSKSPNVVHVWKDEVRHADTVSTPKFLGLEGSTGTWQKELGGVDKAGDGMIIGVLDSGITPENPSFAPMTQSAAGAALVKSKWKGSCDSGTQQPVPCNNKLIGARYYPEGNTVEDFEFTSPRDYNGHGSHTAGTSGGNHGVTATINGAAQGKASGMAPKAAIAAYKVLWATPDGRASGSTASLVSAIDDAVSDGVDVINYSISGSSEYVVTPDEIAFLGAADAGVFVATSAGNSGDTIGESSVAHNAPWTMTVAASTHDRSMNKTVTLGNGQKYPGLGVGPGVGPKPLVTATAAAAAGVPAQAAKECWLDADGNAANGNQPTLDPAKASGKIVVCARGTVARTEKSAAVKAANGAGMVQVNTSDAQSLDGDFHAVPSIHLNATNGAPVLAYAGTAGATATISEVSTAAARAPEMAGFSSYGPALAGGGDLLKPDITAPGSGIIAPVAPGGNGGENWGAYSGTSMSAPHIAGIAALIKQKHTTWSPAVVKSAMMTSATDLDNQGKPIQRSGKNASPLDYGSGHVRPGRAFNPGLAFDAGYSDWVKYACGIGQLQLVTQPGTCDKVGSIDPSNLNYPSISVGDLAGRQVVTRTVKNVDSKRGTYQVKINPPAGYRVTVAPATMSLAPGESRSYKVTVARTSAAIGSWSFGSVSWNSRDGKSVRSPLALRSVAASAPREQTGTGTAGQSAISVTPGFTGTLKSSAVGLVPSTVATVPTTKGTVAKSTVQVPAGTKVVRFATYDADYPGQKLDLDLVVKKDGKEVGSSADATANEAVTLTNPAAGAYTVEIDLYSGATQLDVKSHSFLVSTAKGNLSVAPASVAVTSGTPTTVTAKWTGLTAGQRYLGAVLFSDGASEAARTMLSVNP